MPLWKPTILIIIIAGFKNPEVVYQIGNPGLDYLSPLFDYQNPWMGEVVGGDYQSKPLLGGGQIVERQTSFADRPESVPGLKSKNGKVGEPGQDYLQPEPEYGQWGSWTSCSSGEKTKHRYKTEKETLSCKPPTQPGGKNHRSCPKKPPKTGASCQLTQFGRTCGYNWKCCCGKCDYG